MRRAIQLAQKGLGTTAPNPVVGCVVVCDNTIIGEGYHERYGGPHAEVKALEPIQDPEALANSTLYVTLEPCAHHGKTPPCTDLILKKGIRRVVIGNVDPYPEVSGKGIKKLQDAGVKVYTGCLSEACKHLNRRFFTSILQKRPYIILKWAQSSDGFIAKEDGKPAIISNSLSRQLVHKWRAEEQSILIGKNTALKDDPSLNVRHWFGKNPVRIVLDRNLELPKQLNLHQDSQETIVMNTQKEHVEGHMIYKKYEGDVRSLLTALHKESIQSVLVEGGAQVLQSFIESNLWDEARVFTAKENLIKGAEAPVLKNAAFVCSETLLTDRLNIYYNNSSIS